MTDLEDLEEQPDESLDQLEEKIGKLKHPGKQDRMLGHGMVLATSFGVVVVACLVGGYQLGNYLSHRYDSQLYLIGCLLVALVVAGLAAYKLMKPLLED